MHVRWLELDGTLTTAEELNAAFTAETGDDTPFFTDPGTIPAWTEHAGGKTYILADLDGAEARACVERYGKIES